MALTSRDGPIASKGAAGADEIFLAVGSALSWWEGAEDELLRLFRLLNSPDEHERVARYIKLPRGRRAVMMETALQERGHLLSPAEASLVREAVDALKGLANRRNQISHGHCTSLRRKENGVVVMEGHYLVPAWNEVGPFDREIRFALTVSDILAFREEVRDARWAIVKVALDVQERLQEDEQRTVRERIAALAASASSGK